MIGHRPWQVVADVGNTTGCLLVLGAKEREAYIVVRGILIPIPASLVKAALPSVNVFGMTGSHVVGLGYAPAV
jgi:hypothetical protein